MRSPVLMNSNVGLFFQIFRFCRFAFPKVLHNFKNRASYQKNIYWVYTGLTTTCQHEPLTIHLTKKAFERNVRMVVSVALIMLRQYDLTEMWKLSTHILFLSFFCCVFFIQFSSFVFPKQYFPFTHAVTCCYQNIQYNFGH